MYGCRNRRAFTLIEVLAAVGAFTIAFLAGFAAIGTFMLRQDMNYQRTQAAAAAQFLAEWHTNKVIAAAGPPRPEFCSPSGTASGATLADSPLILAWAENLTNVRDNLKFKGGDFVWTTDKVFVFNDNCSVGGKTIAAHGFGMRNLIVTVSPVVLETAVPPETFGSIPFRQVSFWYGSRSDILALSGSAKTTVEFLGRYLIAEAIP